MNRNVTLALGMVLLFVATVVILDAVMPGPHKPTDYVVMGGAATFLCLVVLFVLVAFVPGLTPKVETKAKEDQTSRTSTDL